MVVAFGEYFIEWCFFPGLKGNWLLFVPGFLVAVSGQCIRTTAMYTAGVSFHHMVQVCLSATHTFLSANTDLRHVSRTRKLKIIRWSLLAFMGTFPTLRCILVAPYVSDMIYLFLLKVFGDIPATLAGFGGR